MTSLATAVVGRTYREHGARIHAALVRRFADLDLAEDAVHEAMVAALEQWGDNVPNDPAAWLVRTAYHKAIDRIRRSQVARDKQGDVADLAEPFAEGIPEEDLFQHDDPLRLIFLCCHPALPFDSQVALTLRTVSCLTTAEIARAFLVPEVTMAQRIVRAKAKIRDAKIPFRTPDESEIDERIDAVLSVVYLVFNEGYAVTAGERLVRDDLCTEALRLVRLLVDLSPSSGPCAGLRALLLLTDARRAARLDANGDVVLLEDQDRSLWNREQTERGLSEVERAIKLGPPRHPYTLQAAIAAVHARARTASDTNWGEIASLYELLLGVSPSPIVELNHAVAVAMARGVEAGLSLLDALSVRGELDGEHLFHAARADLLHRAGLRREARAAYDRAAALVTNEPERRFIEKRRRELR
jgi:RNA polymerase sigma-70 factor (ECF subfamily)